jgi:hypothetical protein
VALVALGELCVARLSPVRGDLATAGSALRQVVQGLSIWSWALGLGLLGSRATAWLVGGPDGPLVSHRGAVRWLRLGVAAPVTLFVAANAWLLFGHGATSANPLAPVVVTGSYLAGLVALLCWVLAGAHSRGTKLGLALVSSPQLLVAAAVAIRLEPLRTALTPRLTSELAAAWARSAAGDLHTLAQLLWAGGGAAAPLLLSPPRLRQLLRPSVATAAVALAVVVLGALTWLDFGQVAQLGYGALGIDLPPSPPRRLVGLGATLGYGLTCVAGLRGAEAGRPLGWGLLLVGVAGLPVAASPLFTTALAGLLLVAQSAGSRTATTELGP